jgi:hypothetical protein
LPAGLTYSEVILNKQKYEKVQILFSIIGQAVARAILDERILDIELSPLFFDLVLDRVINNYSGFLFLAC